MISDQAKSPPPIPPALEQIKALELTIAHQLTLAQAESAQFCRDAETLASKLQREIDETGRTEALTRCAAIITEAETKVQTILANAHHDAATLTLRVPQLIKSTQHDALHLILGIQDKEATS